jgi:hypothetical protein
MKSKGRNREQFGSSDSILAHADALRNVCNTLTKLAREGYYSPSNRAEMQQAFKAFIAMSNQRDHDAIAARKSEQIIQSEFNHAAGLLQKKCITLDLRGRIAFILFQFPKLFDDGASPAPLLTKQLLNQQLNSAIYELGHLTRMQASAYPCRRETAVNWLWKEFGKERPKIEAKWASEIEILVCLCIATGDTDDSKKMGAGIINTPARGKVGKRRRNTSMCTKPRRRS